LFINGSLPRPFRHCDFSLLDFSTQPIRPIENRMPERVYRPTEIIDVNLWTRTPQTASKRNSRTASVRLHILHIGKTSYLKQPHYNWSQPPFAARVTQWAIEWHRSKYAA